MPGLILFLIGLIFLASSFRIEFYYYILYFLGTVAVLAWGWVRYTSRRLSLRREFTDHAFHGETVTVQLHLTNRGFLPVPWLKVEDRLPPYLGLTDSHRAVVTLGPRRSHTVTYELTARNRGYYTIGPAQVEFGDVFGLHERTLATQAPHHLTVYPQILPLVHFQLPSRAPIGQLRAQGVIYEDPSRVVGVRDYSRGDPWRKINWRATAMLGRLQVKKYEPAIILDTMLFVNLNPQEFDLHYVEAASELAISLAASLAHHLTEQRQSVGIVVNGRDPARPQAARRLTPFDFTFSEDQSDAETFDPLFEEELPPLIVPLGKGRGHLMRVLEVLARVQAKGVEPLAQILRRHTTGLSWGSTIVVITWGPAPGLREALIALRRANYKVVLLLVRFGVRDEFPSQMRALGIACQEIRSREDVRAIRPHAHMVG